MRFAEEEPAAFSDVETTIFPHTLDEMAATVRSTSCEARKNAPRMFSNCDDDAVSRRKNRNWSCTS